MHVFGQRHLLIAIGLAAAALMAPAPLLDQELTTQPNILFLLIDDQRNDSLGCAGHTVIKVELSLSTSNHVLSLASLQKEIGELVLMGGRHHLHQREGGDGPVLRGGEELYLEDREAVPDG